MKTKSNKILLAVFVLTICFALNAQQTVTDIDGNVYNTVSIGSQKWMKENLKTTRYNNGDSIAIITDATSWGGASTGNYCYYNNNIANAGIYGNLYNYFAVADSRNICPTGYHVPTDKEWTTLTDFVGGDTIAGAKLKESGTVHWASPNIGADNAYDFTALPAGDRIITGAYYLLSNYAFFWTLTAIDNANAYARAIGNQVKLIDRGSYNKHAGYSVRCIEDPIPDSAKYFGQTPPGDTAVIFAPGIISLPNRDEIQITFSPNGKECYFDAGEILFTKYENNIWTDQIEATMFEGFKFPILSLDGQKMYLIKYSSDWKTSDIWISERTAGEWDETQILPEPLNSGSYDNGCSETLDGDTYFTSNRFGSWGIWCKQASSDEAERLGSVVNSPSASSPCIAHDGSYLIFLRNRESSSTFEDLFISFKDGIGEWTAPLDLEESGAKINIDNYSSGSPNLSPDGKYLFFNRHIPSTGASDIYWVSTSIIDTLKKIAMPTLSVNQTLEQKVKVYPNPTSGQFSISFGSNPVEEARVTIFNLQGRQVFSKTFQNTPSSTIDLTGNAPGMYVIRITANELTYNKKLIIE